VEDGVIYEPSAQDSSSVPNGGGSREQAPLLTTGPAADASPWTEEFFHRKSFDPGHKILTASLVKGDKKWLKTVAVRGESKFF
jgi:hypothetical protein